VATAQRSVRSFAVAYDEELARRIRRVIGSDPELTEKEMFGGLAFLIRGIMAIAASSEGGAMVRVDPAQSDSLLAATTATLVRMCGRDMPGWLCLPSAGTPGRVDSSGDLPLGETGLRCGGR
jgi:hypothetical protein